MTDRKDYIQELLNKINAHKDIEFRHLVEAVTGENPLGYAYSLRMSADPEQEFDATNKEVQNLVAHYSFQDYMFDDEYDQWVDDCKHAVRLIDAALTDPLRLDDPTIDRYEPDNQAIPFPLFDPGYDRRDAWGRGNHESRAPIFAKVHYGRGKTSRDQWKRTTKDDGRDLYILCEYGTFSVTQTARNAAATLKVRTQIRRIKGVATPFLAVGCIQINMRSGVAECGLSGCDGRWQLHHNRPESVALQALTGLTAEPDREYMEYQVLKIMQHVGSHDKSGAMSPILDVSLDRDSDAKKLASRDKTLVAQFNR